MLIVDKAQMFTMILMFFVIGNIWMLAACILSHFDSKEKASTAAAFVGLSYTIISAILFLSQTKP